jgi:hypothetical protein
MDFKTVVCIRSVHFNVSNLSTALIMTQSCYNFPWLIPGSVTGFISDISPSDRSMALGSTRPLVKMSTSNIPGGKGGQCVRLQPPHPHVPNVMKSSSLKLLEPSGPHQACYETPLPLFLGGGLIKLFPSTANFSVTSLKVVSVTDVEC